MGGEDWWDDDDENVFGPLHVSIFVFGASLLAGGIILLALSLMI